ncbi:LapA family protein [Paenibacillus caui]|uniref:LapA family protein n=1 Tax=Paenibacillus caui TaxID=2873927 RepID=UPI001CA87BD6|nr:lipopolysaccharide assembly protein LapA domain-containing protein [Paenibacillus caui]
MKIQWSLILALIFALITAVFAVINVDPVRVNLLFGSVTLPLILLILGSTLLGGIIVGAFGIYRSFRLQKQVKQLNAKLQRIQDETGYDPDAPAPAAVSNNENAEGAPSENPAIHNGNI